MSTKSGRAPACEIRFGCCDERMRNRHDDVARLNAGGHQSESHSIGAAGHADAMLRIAELRELAFKILNHRAADEAGRPKRLLKTRISSASSSLMRSNQIQERNFIV